MSDERLFPMSEEGAAAEKGDISQIPLSGEGVVVYDSEDKPLFTDSESGTNVFILNHPGDARIPQAVFHINQGKLDFDLALLPLIPAPKAVFSFRRNTKYALTYPDLMLLNNLLVPAGLFPGWDGLNRQQRFAQTKATIQRQDSYQTYPLRDKIAVQRFKQALDETPDKIVSVEMLTSGVDADCGFYGFAMEQKTSVEDPSTFNFILPLAFNLNKRIAELAIQLHEEINQEVYVRSRPQGIVRAVTYATSFYRNADAY